MTGGDDVGRRLRVLALAVISTVLTVTAHAAASGRSLSGLVEGSRRLPVLAAAGALSVAVLAALGRRRRPWWLVAVVLIPLQLAQHVVLTPSTPHPAGHLHHAAESGASGYGVVAMLTAHGLAALITGVLLQYAERAVRLLAAWLSWPRMLVTSWRPLAQPSLHASCPLVWHPSSPPSLSGGPGLRGPPGRMVLR